MAEGKKKKTATVRTRVVSADKTPSTKKKKTTKTTVKQAKVTKTTAPVAVNDSEKPTKKSVTKRTAKKNTSNDKAVQQKNMGYFKGAWYELKQVRWPNRKATWGMTLAVLLFSAFFITLILLVDAVFKYLFDLIIQ